MQTVDIVKALPKVEQHVHILGSITPATLLKVIEETGIDAPL
jgi:adenosine deaminase